MSHYKDLIQSSNTDTSEEEKRRIRELQQQGKEELKRRHLQKSGAPRSGLVDTPETEYED